MRNPDLFQGEKFLTKNINYFEGWYFKNSNNKESISFIPGINIDENKKAFIQVITTNSSYFIDYDISEFEFSTNPFYVKIGNNFFSKNNIHIQRDDVNKNLHISGDIKYSNSKNINTSFINPNIMGPFSFVPFMECNHAILSMKNNANGLIKINNKELLFNNDNGYIEKDWGVSFPSSYIWCQGNNFKNPSSSFMLSIADIPFKLFNFKGLISVLVVEDKEFKFTTYNNSKLLNFKLDKNFLNIILQKGKFSLDVQAHSNFGNKLSAPVKGKMQKDIIESINSNITVTLKENNNVIFSDTSNNCGLEVVQNDLGN